MRKLLLTLAILAAAAPAQAGQRQRSELSPRTDFVSAAQDMLGSRGGRRVIRNPDPIYVNVPEYDPETGKYGKSPSVPGVSITIGR